MAKFDSVLACVELPETEPELTLWAMEHKQYGDHVLVCLRKIWRNEWRNDPMRTPGLASFYSVAGEILRESILHLMHTFPHAIRIRPFRDYTREKYAIYCANVHMVSLFAEHDLGVCHKDHAILKWIADNVKFE